MLGAQELIKRVQSFALQGVNVVLKGENRQRLLPSLPAKVAAAGVTLRGWPEGYRWGAVSTDKHNHGLQVLTCLIEVAQVRSWRALSRRSSLGADTHLIARRSGKTSKRARFTLSVATSSLGERPKFCMASSTGVLTRQKRMPRRRVPAAEELGRALEQPTWKKMNQMMVSRQDDEPKRNENGDFCFIFPLDFAPTEQYSSECNNHACAQARRSRSHRETAVSPMVSRVHVEHTMVNRGMQARRLQNCRYEKGIPSDQVAKRLRNRAWIALAIYAIALRKVFDFLLICLFRDHVLCQLCARPPTRTMSHVSEVQPSAATHWPVASRLLLSFIFSLAIVFLAKALTRCKVLMSGSEGRRHLWPVETPFCLSDVCASLRALSLCSFDNLLPWRG